MSEQNLSDLDRLDASDEATPAAKKPRKRAARTSKSSGPGQVPSTPAAAAPAPSAPGVTDGSDLMGLGEIRFADLPQWTAGSYAPFLTGSGAAKLADSGVAPLVAAARGYSRVDETDFAEKMKAATIRSNSGQYRNLAEVIATPGGDGLMMPWFAVSSTHNALRQGVDPEPSGMQIRPCTPVVSPDPRKVDRNGSRKTMKYVFPAGFKTPLDVHPAIPTEWIDGAPVVMFTEGLLKGDAALSAWLKHLGATWEELADGSEGARERMTALMQRLAPGEAGADERMVIITLAGVYNTKQNPVDWREIDLRGREGWIAFDADVAKNPDVWTAARRLWSGLETTSRMERLKIMNPVATQGEGAAAAKMGVDDYLAKAGDWLGLTAFLQDSLPPAPPRNEDEVDGAWRVSRDGRSTEECSRQVDGNGVPQGIVWVPRIPLGGRILSSEVRRRPTAPELATGEFEKGVKREEHEEVRARVLIEWTRHGLDYSAEVDGPENFLNYSPEQWARQGADIPTKLLQHPAWPPTGKDGASWLSAIKANRDDEIIETTRWSQMGWVPVRGAAPVFVVADQVIGGSDLPEGAVVPGVGEDVLEAAAHYGVNDEAAELDWSLPASVTQMRQDLEQVLRVMILNKPWTDPGAAAVALTAGLRPVIPLRPRATCFLVGSKGSGKSWTAERMMSFWARTGAEWVDHLPGSAKDSMAFVENAVSRTPIWVVDDLAPSSSARQSESENAKLEDLTRNIFNNASRGRMNADMTTRRSNAPIAQMIITAENDLQVASVRERLVPVRFRADQSLASDRSVTEAAVELHREGVPARLTAHLIRYVRLLAEEHEDGWLGVVSMYRTIQSNLEAGITEQLNAEVKEGQQARSGAVKRAALLASDLSTVLWLMRDFAEYVGLDPKLAALLDEDGLRADLVKLIHAAHADNGEASSGRSILTALRNLLASGRAHVTCPDAPASAPVRTGDGEFNLRCNFQMGWRPTDQDGVMEPLGVRIGEVITQATTGQLVVVFNEQVAFNEARRFFPELIPPGSLPYQTWSGVWDESFNPELTKKTMDARKKMTKPPVTHEFKYRPDGQDQRYTVRGVPVRMTALLDMEKKKSEEESED